MQELGADPLLKMESPVLVKENPVRQVFKCGKLYFKYDKRFFNGLAKEFRNAMKIASTGIPAVEHLAVSRHWLITASAENCVELGAFLRNNVPSAAMLDAFGKFILTMKENNLNHGDLHSGNILYNAQENSFLLVDLCSAKIASSCSDNQDKSYAHLTLELRRFLPRESLFGILQICSGQKNPSTLFDEMLNRDTVQVLRSWQKRKSQILSGYKKFIRLQDDMIFAADAPTAIADAEKINCSAKKYMLLHHFLELNHIPHKRVFAVDGNIACLEPVADAIQAPEDLFSDFSERLALCGITSSPQDWVISSGKVKFINLASAVEQCELLES